MEYGMAVRLDAPIEQAEDRVRAALAEQGFGVLTEIDVQATLREKLGEETQPYRILGACNPQLAHRALGVDNRIGLLLPCNVVLRSEGEATVVEALDPQVMVSVPDEPKLQPIADEAGRRLRDALRTLTAG
ncbi:DUF302 domain-containing protein [Saccharomonospora marina]|nr:DUF302 domain-containing protein [Saccharomonospora marina]